MSESGVTDPTSCWIVVHRESRRRRDRKVRYGLRIDGVPVGKIRNGETQTYLARPGEHEVRLTTYRFWTSKRSVFSLGQGESAKFICGPGGPSITLAFDVLFRPHRYLSLTGPK
jgi:hypothetical protein